MKIIHVCERFPPSIGGVENYVYNLSQELSSSGHDITVLSSDIISKSGNSIVRGGKSYERLNNNLDVYRFRTYPPGIYYASAYAIFPSLIQKILYIKPDIINVHSLLFPSDIAALTARILQIPYVVTIHGFGSSNSGNIYRFLSHSYLCTLGRKSLNSANRIITLSPNGVRYLQKLGIESRKIQIIPNGIDIERFQLNADSLKFKKNSDNVILFVGSLTLQKGVHHLIRSMPMILREIPNARLIIVGPDYGYRKHLEDLAKDIGLISRVLFTGPLYGDELCAFYHLCDVFCLPSSREGLPTVILEAMACGKPIIASNVGGIPDIVENNISGILVDYGNEKKLARSIIKLLSNKSLLNNMGCRGIEIVKNYSWTQIGKEIESVYQGVLKGKIY